MRSCNYSMGMSLLFVLLFVCFVVRLFCGTCALTIWDGKNEVR